MDEVSLREVPMLALLGDQELRVLENLLRIEDLPAGHLLIREGEPGEEMYIILRGELDVIVAMGSPNERRVAHYGPGEYVGEMSLLEPQCYRVASVRTSRAARLAALSRADFDQLLQRYPPLALSMLRELSSRLRRNELATIHDLQAKNQQLAAAYQELSAAHEQLMEKEKLERELQVARRIQESMLPARLPAFPGYDLGARMLPASAVGGDLYDFVALDSDRLGIFIGDVSDKGVPAALFMALTRSLLRAESRRKHSPGSVLRRVNRLLIEMNQAGMFVTLLYAILDRRSSTFTYARAGHELPILLDASGYPAPVEHGAGQTLGILPEPAVDEQSLCMLPGNTLLLFTDGAVDTVNAQGEFFGRQRLQEILTTNRQHTAQGICDEIMAALAGFHGSAAQFDDITLVAVKSSFEPS